MQLLRSISLTPKHALDFVCFELCIPVRRNDLHVFSDYSMSFLGGSVTSSESIGEILCDGSGDVMSPDIPKPLILHLASLSITHETFVKPILCGPLMETYNHILMSGPNAQDAGGEGSRLVLGRGAASIFHSWISAK